MANEPGAPAPTPAENNAPAAAPVAAPAAPAPSSPAPTSASESLFKKLETHVPEKKMSWDDIQATMNGTAPATVPQNSTTAPVEGAKVGDGVVPVPAAQPTSAPAVVAQPVQPSAEEQLRADLAARDSYIATLIQGGPQPAGNQPTPAGAPAAPVDDIPPHMYQLPQELVAGLRSEDPTEAGKALSNYTSLVTRTIHRQLREEYSGKIQEVVSQIPAMVDKIIKHQTETKAIFEDFYGEHKDLNKPELYPVILNAAIKLMNETKATSWTPQFKTALAARVRGALGMGNVAQPAAPAAPVYQPAMMNGGARPSAPVATTADKQAEDIMATLRSGF